MSDGFGLAGEGWLRWLDLLVRASLVVWMARISYADHRHGIIPNRLTAPLFLGLSSFQILYSIVVLRGIGQEMWWLRPVFVVFSLSVIFGLWMLHFIGGGDAKFMMALFALFPHGDWVVVLALLLLVITLPLALWEMRHQRPREILRSLRARLLTGEVFPTEEELQERGRRFAWTFAVPGAVYTFVYWDGIEPYFGAISRFLQGTM